MDFPFKVVAHRGLPEAYPENSLVGAIAALESGADALEIDVQMTLDGRVVVIHDPSLKRTASPLDANFEFDVCELAFVQLKNSSIHEPARLADRFDPEYIMSLDEFCAKIGPYLRDDKKIFIEIKQESIDAFSMECVVEAVISESDALSNHRVFISFNDEALIFARQSCGAEIGWILEDLTAAQIKKANHVSGEYIVIDVKKIPDHIEKLPTQSAWFIYDLVDPVIAEEWSRRGVEWIETWDCRRFQEIK